MKLLIILPSTQRGGAEEYTLKIAQVALQAGWQIHTAFPQTLDTASLIADFRQQNIEYHPLNIADQEKGKLVSIKASLLRLFRTQKLLSQLQPDVVLLNLPAHHLGFISLWLCGLLKIPTAVVFHLIPFSASFSKSKLRAYHWAKARNQKWITISNYNCQRLAEEFSLPSQEFCCIYNGIKQESLRPSNLETKQQLRAQIRQELDLEANSQILLTVARLHPQKGHDYLIPIMPEIIAHFPDVQFIWVGDGEYQAYLSQQLQEYQVKERVIFLGYRQDIPNLLAAADLFLFPSYQEGLPFAVLEAMVYGVPIVASDTGGIPEMIVNEKHGLLFRTGDRQDLLQKLDWALNHPASMAQMANMAQVQVQKFSEATMLQNTLEVLQNLKLIDYKSPQINTD
jgi:glycosyltransferase involved in cell wall biosynthesis